MKRMNWRNAGVVTIVAALMATIGFATTQSASAATALCVVDTIDHPAVTHDERKFKKVVEGEDETFKTEYRYRTRTVLYEEVEHKYIKSTYAFVDGGNTTVNGHNVSGHWVGGYPNAWRAIPDSVINAVWGAGGIDPGLIGGSEANPKGNVPLNVYGGPNISVPYYASTETVPAGSYTDWGPWSAWSMTNPGAETATKDIETQQTSNHDGTPDVTWYWQTGGNQTTDIALADWTTTTPPAPWVEFDKRTITDQDAYTENVYGPCKDAVASVTPKDAATCLTDSTVDFALTNAEWVDPIDLSPGIHPRKAKSLTNHLFSDGKDEWTVTYTITAADPSLCPHDASASASVETVQTCTADSTPSFTLNKASWESPTFTTNIGLNSRWAKSDTGVFFPDGSTRLEVFYTITAADRSLCPEDASASYKVKAKETCSASSTVELILVNAVPHNPLENLTSVGFHHVQVDAVPTSLFPGKHTSTFVDYTITGHQTGKSCDTLAMTAVVVNIGVPVGAVLAILAGIGFVLRRQLKRLFVKSSFTV